MEAPYQSKFNANERVRSTGGGSVGKVGKIGRVKWNDEVGEWEYKVWWDEGKVYWDWLLESDIEAE